MTSLQSLLDEEAWYTEGGPENDVILSSRARISRNLSGYNFPYKLTEKELEEVQQKIEQAFCRIRQNSELKLSKMEDLSVLERRKLIEKHFISQNYSLEKDKLVVLDPDKLITACVNVRDHLQLAAFAGGADIMKAYSRVNTVEHELEKYLDFSVSLDKGYLSADIKNCGTGLQISIILHLPALEYSSLTDRAFKRIMDAGYEIKGYTGGEEGSLGALYELYNPISIGESEKELMQKLAQTGTQLVDYERRAREELKRHRRAELEDLVYRALGTLKYCRLVEEKEAIELLSMIRLGTFFGWFEIPQGLFTRLFILVGKAHIQQMIGNKESKDFTQQIKQKRAELIQYALGFASE